MLDLQAIFVLYFEPWSMCTKLSKSEHYFFAGWETKEAENIFWEYIIREYIIYI